MFGGNISDKRMVAGVSSVLVILAVCACVFFGTGGSGFEEDSESPDHDGLVTGDYSGQFVYRDDKTMTELIGYNGWDDERVEIPASVVLIDNGVFAHCSKLSYVDFSKAVNLERIADMAFHGCPLASLDLSKCTSLTTIGDDAVSTGAFSNTDIANAIFPASLRMIGDSTFRDCRELTTMTLPKSSQLEKICDLAFRNTGLHDLVLNEAGSLASIGEDAFGDCSNLQSIRFPSTGSLVSIGKFAFTGSALAEVDLSDTSVTELGKDVFKDCIHLQKVTINSQLESIFGAYDTYYKDIHGSFCGCTSLKVFSIPSDSSLAAIGEHAFDRCPLVSLDLSETSITALSNLGIGRDAGSDYNPGTLYLPKSLTTLGADVVYRCPDIISVGSDSSLTSVDKGFVNGASPTFGGNALSEDRSANANYVKNPSGGAWHSTSYGVYTEVAPALPTVPSDLVLTGDTVVDYSSTIEISNLDTNGYNMIVSGGMTVHGNVTGLTEGSYIFVESGANVTVHGNITGSGGIIDNEGTVSMDGDMVMKGIRLAGNLNVSSHRLTLENVAVLGTVDATSSGSEISIGRTVTIGWNTMVLGSASSCLAGDVSFQTGSHVSVYSGGSFNDTTPGDNLSTAYSVNGFGFATVYTSDPGIGISVVDVLVRNTLGIGSDVPIVWTSDGNELPDGTHVGDYDSVGTSFIPAPPEEEEEQEQPETPPVIPPFVIDPDWDRPNVPPVVIIPTPVPQPQVPEDGEEDGGSDSVTVAVAAAAVAAALVAAMVLFRKD